MAKTVNTGLNIKDDAIVDGKVGIGTATPSEKLSVEGNVQLENIWFNNTINRAYLGFGGTNDLRIYSVSLNQDIYTIDLATGNHKIGSGVSDTSSKLVVASQTVNQTALTLSTTSNTINSYQDIKFKHRTDINAVRDSSRIRNTITNNIAAANEVSSSLGFFTDTPFGLVTEKMTILGDGNVGIGTTAPTAKLNVQTSTSAGANNALLVQNNLLGGTDLFTVKDDGVSTFNASGANAFNIVLGTVGAGSQNLSNITNTTGGGVTVSTLNLANSGTNSVNNALQVSASNGVVNNAIQILSGDVSSNKNSQFFGGDSPTILDGTFNTKLSNTMDANINSGFEHSFGNNTTLSSQYGFKSSSVNALATGGAGKTVYGFHSQTVITAGTPYGGYFESKVSSGSDTVYGSYNYGSLTGTSVHTGNIYGSFNVANPGASNSASANNLYANFSEVTTVNLTQSITGTAYGQSIVFGISASSAVANVIGLNVDVTNSGAVSGETYAAKFAGGKINILGIPTSATGLVAGDVWNNAGVLTIV